MTKDSYFSPRSRVGAFTIPKKQHHVQPPFTAATTLVLKWCRVAYS